MKITRFVALVIVPVAFLVSFSSDVQCFGVHHRHCSSFVPKSIKITNGGIPISVQVLRTGPPKKVTEDTCIDVVTPSTSSFDRLQFGGKVRSRLVGAIMAIYAWLKGPTFLSSERNTAFAMTLKEKLFSVVQFTSGKSKDVSTATTLQVKTIPSIVRGAIQSTYEKSKDLVTNQQFLLGSGVALFAVGAAIQNRAARRRQKQNTTANDETKISQAFPETPNMALFSSPSPVAIENDGVQTIVTEEIITVQDEIVVSETFPQEKPILASEGTIESRDVKIEVADLNSDESDEMDHEAILLAEDEYRIPDVVVSAEALGVVEETLDEDKAPIEQQIEMEVEEEKMLDGSDDTKSNGKQQSDDEPSILSITDDASEDESSRLSLSSTTARIKKFFKKSLLPSDEPGLIDAAKSEAALDIEPQADKNKSSVALAVPITKAMKKNVSSFLFGVNADEVTTARDVLANKRRQPKSPAEERRLQAKYDAIESLEERAFQILVDLGMVVIHSDLDDVGEWE